MPEILIHTPINFKILGTDRMGEQRRGDSWNWRAFGGNVEKQCIRTHRSL